MQMYLSEKCAALTQRFNITITSIRGKAEQGREEIPVLLPLQISPQPAAETSDPLFQRLPVQVLPFHPKTPFVFNLCHNPLFSTLFSAHTSLWPGTITCGSMTQAVRRAVTLKQ